MLTTIGSGEKSYTQGEQYEIDSATAEKWIGADIAERVDDASQQLKDMAVSFAKEAQEGFLKSFRDEFSGAVKAPAYHRSEPEEKKSFTGFLRAVKSGNEKVIGSYNKVNAQNTESLNDGGALVPREFISTLFDVPGYDSGFFLNRCAIKRMSSDTAEYPYKNQEGTLTATGTSNFYGGARVYWGDELDTLPQAQLNLKKGLLISSKMGVYWDISNEELEDSGGRQDEINRINFNLAATEDLTQNCIIGSGVNRPSGFAHSDNSNLLISVSRNTTNRIKLEDFANMYAKLPPRQSDRSLMWIATPGARGDIISMQSSNGALVWVKDMYSGLPTMQVLGIPVFFSEACSALGSANDLLLVDASYYQLGVARDIRIRVSEHVGFLQDKVTFALTGRFAGQPAIKKKIILRDGSTTVSPFVGLAA